MTPVEFDAELKTFTPRARNDGDIVVVGFTLPLAKAQQLNLLSLYGERVTVKLGLSSKQDPLFPKQPPMQPPGTAELPGVPKPNKKQ